MEEEWMRDRALLRDLLQKSPLALLYSLPRDLELQAAQVPLPHSSRTIWKILHATGCLLTHSKESPHPNEHRDPLEEIQMDFKDIGCVSPDQSSQGKRQHVIEVCNAGGCRDFDCGCRAQAREDFHEQTALEVVIAFLRRYGCPHQMTFDRDPRWVGSVSGRDFPSPLRRLAVRVWALRPTSAHHIGQTKMPMWNDITEPMDRNAYRSISPVRSKR